MWFGYTSALLEDLLYFVPKKIYSLNWIKCSCDRFYDGGPFLFGKSLPNISYRENESLAWHIFRSIIKLMKQMTNDLRRRPISCYSWVEKQTQCCIINAFIAQSSRSIFAQKYLHKCKDTYFILQKSIFTFTKTLLEQRIRWLHP